MSTLQPVAVACADIHLSHKPPAARAGEDNWYHAMARPLQEIRELAAMYNVPVLCSGDVFHSWNSPPELINFAISNLPKMIAIAGQHDMPYHNEGEIKKSAFWTLVEARKILIANPQGLYFGGGHDAFAFGFGWGEPVLSPDHVKKGFKVALVHEYVWHDKAKYTGAPENQQLNIDKYRGYNTVIIGDNHIPWNYDTSICNMGSLMRRNSDQVNHHPRVGIIMSDGSVQSHYLDCSKDVLETPSVSQMVDAGINFTDVMNELRNLSGATLDFAALLRQLMEQKGTDPRVAKYLLEALEHDKG